MVCVYKGHCCPHYDWWFTAGGDNRETENICKYGRWTELKDIVICPAVELLPGGEERL